MPNLTETILRLGSPVGEYLSEYGATSQRLGMDAQRKASIEMQKLDYDLRSQMEQRRQAAEEKKAEQAHAENLIGAGQEYAKFVYDATLQGMADPNVFLSGWSGVAKRRNIALTEPPPLTPEEVALIVKKAQGDKTMAEVAEKAKQAKAVADEMRKNEAQWDEGGTRYSRVYDPVTGELKTYKAPRWKAGEGGGGRGSSDENLALDADIAIRQYLGKMATNPEDAPAWTKWKKHGLDPNTGERGLVQRFDMTTALQNVGNHILEIPGMTAKKYQAWARAQGQQAVQQGGGSTPPRTQFQPANAPTQANEMMVTPEDIEYIRQTNPQLLGNGRKANADIMGALEETGINTPDEMREALKALGWSL